MVKYSVNSGNPGFVVNKAIIINIIRSNTYMMRFILDGCVIAWGTRSHLRSVTAPP